MSIVQSLTENYHVLPLESAVSEDKLFIFRLDSHIVTSYCSPSCRGLPDGCSCGKTQLLDSDLIVGWFQKYKILDYIICPENGSETGKLHYHVVSILPDAITHKYASDQFNKEIVRIFKLEKHQFSKKKNGEKQLTKNPEFKKIMEKYKMEWYDYCVCYYCKEYHQKVDTGIIEKGIFFKITALVFYNRYMVIQDELQKLPKNGRKNPAMNHMKSLIDGWDPKNMHGAIFQHGVMIMDEDVQSTEEKKLYLEYLYKYIIDYFREHNSKSRLGQILSQPRVQQYMYTILAYYHPVAIRDNDESIINHFLPQKWNN